MLFTRSINLERPTPTRYQDRNCLTLFSLHLTPRQGTGMYCVGFWVERQKVKCKSRKCWKPPQPFPDCLRFLNVYSTVSFHLPVGLVPLLVHLLVPLLVHLFVLLLHDLHQLYHRIFVSSLPMLTHLRYLRPSSVPLNSPSPKEAKEFGMSSICVARMMQKIWRWIFPFGKNLDFPIWPFAVCRPLLPHQWLCWIGWKGGMPRIIRILPILWILWVCREGNPPNKGCVWINAKAYFVIPPLPKIIHTWE